MNVVKKLLDKINGLHYHQEYLCLAKESFDQPLHVYLVHNSTVIKDITELHLFVGYSPLVFALSSYNLPPSESQIINVVFCHRSLQPNEKLKKKDAIALLSLQKIHELKAQDEFLFFYEGIKGSHHFISGFH